MHEFLCIDVDTVYKCRAIKLFSVCDAELYVDMSRAAWSGAKLWLSAIDACFAVFNNKFVGEQSNRTGCGHLW